MASIILDDAFFVRRLNTSVAMGGVAGLDREDGTAVTMVSSSATCLGSVGVVPSLVFKFLVDSYQPPSLDGSKSMVSMSSCHIICAINRPVEKKEYATSTAHIHADTLAPSLALIAESARCTLVSLEGMLCC